MLERKSTKKAEAEFTGKKTKAWGERKTEKVVGGLKKKKAAASK